MQFIRGTITIWTSIHDVSGPQSFFLLIPKPSYNSRYHFLVFSTKHISAKVYISLILLLRDGFQLYQGPHASFQLLKNRPILTYLSEYSSSQLSSHCDPVPLYARSKHVIWHYIHLKIIHHHIRCIQRGFEIDWERLHCCQHTRNSDRLHTPRFIE